MTDLEIKKTPLPSVQPVLTDAEHMLNLCTLGGGFIVSGRIGEAIGTDVLEAYKKIITAYSDWSDAGKPIP
jgi:hypothetical protein